MTPSERNALINFFGMMHAEAKTTDSNIIGSSKDVRPISHTFRETLETALSQPAAQPMPQAAPPVFVPPPVQAAPTLAPPPVQMDYTNSQVHQPGSGNIASSDIAQQLKEINLTLIKIVDILTKKHGAKKPRSTKQA